MIDVTECPDRDGCVCVRFGNQSWCLTRELADELLAKLLVALPGK